MSLIRVRVRPGDRTRGLMLLPHRAVPVALGRSGVKADKREGDGATPRGSFHPLRVWWRADRGTAPQTRLPTRRIAEADAWCEDPADRRYNRPFKLRTNEDADRLTRHDRLYDLIVEIDHNARPRIAHRGSAVFIHVARPGFAPTAGCVALRPAELRRLLGVLSRNTRIEIH